jgi:acyl-coenzyme A thioesterase PaaI-like protein
MADDVPWAPTKWHGGEYVLAPPPPNSAIYLCTACARLGHCRLGLQTERLRDESVTTTVMCSRDNEGGPGVAHGAWIAGVFDELAGHVPLLHRILAVTQTMTIRFLKPVPVEKPLLGEARALRKDDRRWFVEAALRMASTGVELARAEAVLVLRDGGHYERHRRWMAEHEREAKGRVVGPS